MKISTAEYDYCCDTCTHIIKPGEAFVDFAGFTDFTGAICFNCIETAHKEIGMFNEGT